MVKIADFIEAPNSGGNYTKNLLVVHDTEGPEVDGAARATVAYWKRARTGSTQYVVDGKEIIQAVREKAYAWAAGTTANKHGIHVEHVGFAGQTKGQWDDAYSRAELAQSSELFAELAHKYNIPIRRLTVEQIRHAAATGRPQDGGICGHSDISAAFPGETTHTDPGPNFPWGRFIGLVREAAKPPAKPKVTTSVVEATPLGYVHHSGRFDRTGEALGQSLVGLALLPGVDLIACTEVANESRSQAAAEALAKIGWAYLHPIHSECAFAYRQARLSSEKVAVEQLSTIDTWNTSGTKRGLPTALFGLFRENGTGRSYLASTGHTASHVQHGNGWYNNNRARQHRDALAHWNEKVLDYRHAWKPSSGTVVSMDLNLDLALPWVRTYLRTSFPSLGLVQDASYVDTFGVRTIDAVLVGRRLSPLAWFKGKRIRVLTTGDSDHRTVLTRLGRVVRKVVRPS